VQQAKFCHQFQKETFLIRPLFVFGFVDSLVQQTSLHEILKRNEFKKMLLLIPFTIKQKMKKGSKAAAGNPCRFFLQGNCKHGANCKFFHDVRINEKKRQSLTPLEKYQRRSLGEKVPVNASLSNVEMAAFERFSVAKQEAARLSPDPTENLNEIMMKIALSASDRKKLEPGDTALDPRSLALFETELVMMTCDGADDVCTVCGLLLHSIIGTYLIFLPCGHVMHYECACQHFAFRNFCPAGSFSGQVCVKSTQLAVSVPPSAIQEAHFANAEHAISQTLLAVEKECRIEHVHAIVTWTGEKTTRRGQNQLSQGNLDLRLDRDSSNPYPLRYLTMDRSFFLQSIRQMHGSIILRIFLGPPDPCRLFDTRFEHDIGTEPSPLDNHFKRVFSIVLTKGSVVRKSRRDSAHHNLFNWATGQVLPIEPRVIYS